VTREDLAGRGATPIAARTGTQEEIAVSSIPPACQGFADTIAEREEEILAEQDGLEGLAGSEKWAALGRIAALRRQLDQAKRDLNLCVLTNAPGYATDVVIYDLAGTIGIPAQGRIWRLSPPSFQQELEVRTVQAGRISFIQGPAIAGASIGISINEAPNPAFPGPLFRSGPLPSLPAGAPANPGGLVEIGTDTTGTAISATAVNAAVAAAPLPALPPGITVTGRSLTLGAGSATLTATGTAATAIPIIGTVAVPFTYTLIFNIIPSSNMNNLAEICVLVSLGATLTTTLGGVIGFIFNLLAPTLEPTITATVVPAIQGAINAGIASAAPAALGRPLRPGVDVISMRRMRISPGPTGAITFVPAIGAYGGIFP
jgi:hypothetical protein